MEKMSLLQRHVNTLSALLPHTKRGKGRGTLPLRALSDALFRLQRGLTGERTLAGDFYMEDDSLLAAYLLYYWPVSYQQLRHIIGQLPPEAFSFTGRTAGSGPSILDTGSGPGPASAALCDFLQEQAKAGPSPSVCFCDHSPKALSLAQGIFAKDFPNVQTQIQVSDFEKAPFSSESLPEGKKFSVAIFCHSLNELWQEKKDRIDRRTGLIEQILDSYMEKEGLLILCEPAQTKSSRELISIRDSLLARRSDLDLLAPCTGSGTPCPALRQGEGTSCHSEGNWEAVEPATSLAEAAGLDRKSIKMSYLAFKKTEESNGREGQAAQQETAFTARVVSDPMLNKAGRIRFVLCDGHERFSLSAKKGDAAAERKGFWKLKRDTLICVRKAERRGEAGKPSFAVTEETEIDILTVADQTQKQ